MGRLKSSQADAGSAQMSKHAQGHALPATIEAKMSPRCIPKQPDSQTVPRSATGSGHDGALTLSGAPFHGTWAQFAAEDASPDYNLNNEVDRFSSRVLPSSFVVTRGILGEWHPPPPEGPQVFSGLLTTSPTTNNPRRRDLNTSPDHSIGRSDGQQIAPPTKNGHAPPPIESRKSSQSVNPYHVWTWKDASLTTSHTGKMEGDPNIGRARVLTEGLEILTRLT
ncbi:hypothetical protein HYC85_030535 [Camellia sinensis]|uniref:Uncharacterized protein n=1 Tax=Camellia sinensis TaxID=4442 RepID=A0A7J7G4V5_CAMSI|nr:hypothetical protein HYC85_030535 [Camellia sinensis]